MGSEFQESEILELKKSTSELKEALTSIASILNKHGRGELYFGVRNDGRVVGQTVSERTLRSVSKAVSDNIEPKIFPNVDVVVNEGKRCVRVGFRGVMHPILPMEEHTSVLETKTDSLAPGNWRT